MRDKEDDHLCIFHMIQKSPNVGCRDKNSETSKQDKECHESRHTIYFYEEFRATVTTSQRCYKSRSKIYSTLTLENTCCEGRVSNKIYTNRRCSQHTHFIPILGI